MNRSGDHDEGADGRERIGWWFALEPLGADSVAWSLIRVDDRPPDGPVGAGLLTGVSALRMVAEGLPPGSAASGELWTGPLIDRGAELATAVQLGLGLLPDALRAELLAADLGSVRHTVTVACRGWLAQVPWEVLALDPVGDVRLIERARVAAGLSPTINAGRRRAPVPRPGAPALRIIDPGGRSDPSLRPIYPGGYPLEWYDNLLDGERLRPQPRTLSTGQFGELLSAESGWSRLFYFGHCLPGTADTPAGAALVLSTSTSSERFTAHAWLGEPDTWPCPARVALIACGSDDSAQIEQSGLPVAAVNAGAELLTVTRWTLPLDVEPPRQAATTTLALAVDAAHQQDDPLAAIRDWQCRQLATWRDLGTKDFSPLLWGALATYLVPSAVFD